jgi:hypothetical protein
MELALAIYFWAKIVGGVIAGLYVTWLLWLIWRYR